MKFLDLAKIYVRSGRGGHGCMSFRREKFVEFGGPDGGNGGRGGDVVAEAVSGLNTLVDFRFMQHAKAKNGRPGEGRGRTGANGSHAYVRVPVGTEILDENREFVIADMTEVGQRVILAEGGGGGRGNAHYKTSTNRAPRRVDDGRPEVELTLWLRLKLIADVGLVGLPNAGKSTFLAAVSRAHPRIAAYPFTTLHPNLGVVYLDGEEFVVADIPGLIEGAHEGAGLGDRFLGHVERCAVLLHLVDGTVEDVEAAYRTVRGELEAYGEDLARKPTIVALNKIDALDEETMVARRRCLERASGAEVVAISAVAGSGVEATLRRLAEIARQARRANLPDAGETAPWRPI